MYYLLLLCNCRTLFLFLSLAVDHDDEMNIHFFNDQQWMDMHNQFPALKLVNVKSWKAEPIAASMPHLGP